MTDAPSAQSETGGTPGAASGERGRDDAAVLADYLRDHDVPCPACSYNLRGVGTGRCPECGLAVTLRVAEQMPHGAYWFAAVSALAWPVLFDGIMAFVWLDYLVQTLQSRQSARDVLTDQRALTVPAAAACTAMLVWLLRSRKRPWRPRTRRLVLWSLWGIFALHAFWLVPLFVTGLLRR